MKKHKKFMKKPIVIKAYQTKTKLIINTLEGPLTADKGDWIITGIRGEQYPCKPDVFEQTYVEVPNNTPVTPYLKNNK